MMEGYDLRLFVDETSLYNRIVLGNLLPGGVWDPLPHFLQTWLRNYIAGCLLYLVSGSLWCFYIYHLYRNVFLPKGSCEDEILKGGEEDLKCLRNSTQLPDFNLGMENPTSGAHEMTILPMEDKWTPESLVETNGNSGTFAERYTELLLNSSGDRSCSEGGGGESDSDGNGGGDRNFYDDDNKNYWDDILNLVNFSPSDSPIS